MLGLVKYFNNYRRVTIVKTLATILMFPPYKLSLIARVRVGIFQAELHGERRSGSSVFAALNDRFSFFQEDCKLQDSEDNFHL